MFWRVVGVGAFEIFKCKQINLHFILKSYKNMTIDHQNKHSKCLKTACSWGSCVTYVDNESQWLSRVMFNQLLLVGGEKLRVLHIFQQEVILIWAVVLSFFIFLFLAVRSRGALVCVEDPVQEEPHRGLLGLAGRVGRTMDGGVGDHAALLRTRT